MTQTQTIAKIITERLSWRVVTAEGKEVKKPEGYSELETLLILHKSEIRVEITGPGTPHPLQVELDETHAGWKTARDEICKLREEVTNLRADLQQRIDYDTPQ